MRIWDRGRFAEVGFDIRGGKLHSLAGKFSIWIGEHFQTMGKPWTDDKGRRRASLTLAGRMQVALDCFCEACIRSFLPWPFGW